MNVGETSNFYRLKKLPEGVWPWAYGMLSFLLVVFCYQSFSQPIFFDRSYLLYMSQAISRGQHLYGETPFGYTPFSTIVVGWLLRVGAFINFNSITCARILGIILHTGTTISLFYVIKRISNTTIGHLTTIMYLGCAYLSILHGINAEPKLFVIFFSTWAIFFVHRQNWFGAGLVLSLASMCWQASVISFLPCLLVFPWRSRQVLSKFSLLTLGTVLGLLPTITYVTLTGSWLAFWNQVILRKLHLAGLGVTSPFGWYVKTLIPHFATEFFHFILAFIGLVILISCFLSSSLSHRFGKIDKNIFRYLIFYALTWATFNSFEFQGSIDIATLLPVLLLFSSIPLYLIFTRLKKHSHKLLFIFTLLLYNFGDVPFYQIPYTFQEQKSTFEHIAGEHKKVFTIGFESYYTILEKRAPSKLLRMASHEDFLLNLYYNDCEKLVTAIKEHQPSVVLVADARNRVHSPMLKRLVQILGYKKERKSNFSNCSNLIIDQHLHKQVNSMEMGIQNLLWGSAFYTSQAYDIYLADWQE